MFSAAIVLASVVSVALADMAEVVSALVSPMVGRSQ
jgi:hypothetical protein